MIKYINSKKAAYAFSSGYFLWFVIYLGKYFAVTGNKKAHTIKVWACVVYAV